MAGRLLVSVAAVLLLVVMIAVLLLVATGWLVVLRLLALVGRVGYNFCCGCRV